MAVLEVHGLHQYFEQGTVNENHALKLLVATAQVNQRC